TGRSERTLWRWIADGTLSRADNQAGREKTMIHLHSVEPYFSLPLHSEDFDLLVEADAGNPEAQNDLALLFLANAKPEGGIYWLNLAAAQGHADAMHWLGRCYIEGNGLLKDENLGIMWLAKAAAQGHL